MNIDRSCIVSGRDGDGNLMSLDVYQVALCRWLTPNICQLWLKGNHVCFQFRPDIDDRRDWRHPSHQTLSDLFPAPKE